MKIGVIADDFTGASDIALTLAEAGMRTEQYVGVPARQTVDVDAGVVALKSRTTPAEQAITESLAACEWLLDQGAEQIIFKVCSTFDSTADGNIGPVSAALAERLGETQVAVCPAFPETGRIVCQGHLIVGDKLLHESGMKDHPLTPMLDSDLRRVLQAQTSWQVAHIPIAVVAKGSCEIRAALSDRSSHSMVILDAVTDNNLCEIGTALQGRKLITGGSGVAIGLPANFGAEPATPSWQVATGKGVVLSGSCSDATRRQVDTYKKIAPSREVLVSEVMKEPDLVSQLAAWALAQEETPLIYTSAKPDDVRSAQEKYGKEHSALAIDAMFARLARDLSNGGVERIIVAGGETSGAVMAGLGSQILEIGPRLAAGVPALRIKDRNLALALKSGNFGGEDFFREALVRLAEPQ